MRARKYSIYIKSLKGVSARIRFQGQKSTRKGDTEMQVIIDKVEDLKNKFVWFCFDKKIRNETLERYGIEKQSLVAMEELSELQKAISKLVRNPEEKTKPLEFKGLRHNLIEEMADVLICMDQLIEYYQIQGIEIQDTIQAKQERQAKRLEEE
jgi:hypothetical protein